MGGSFAFAARVICNRGCLLYFGLLLATGISFVFPSFMLLAVRVVTPQKFAICFTPGCMLIIASFFVLRGPRNELMHMISKKRLPISLVVTGIMVLTIYVSMVLHSYVPSVIFSAVQVLALSYYVMSYCPGGPAEMRYIFSAFTSNVFKGLGRLLRQRHPK